MTGLWEVLGWAGGGAVLLAYALLSAGRLAPDWRYQALNLAGSCGLAANSLVHAAWPSVSVNVIWLLVGLTALAGQLQRRRAHSREVSGPGAGQPRPIRPR